MIQALNQFRRIFSDDGRGDKDFTEQEARLREAHRNLVSAISSVTKASEILTSLIVSKNVSLH